MFTYRSNNPIEMTMAAKIAPAIFSPRAHVSRSEQYAYIPTHEIVEQMHNEGFDMYSISQARSKNIEKNMTAKHVIRFRHAGIEQYNVNDEFFEICLMNSHDGSTSLQVFAGLFRLVCSNGLVIGKSTYDGMRTYHRNITLDSVIERSNAVLNAAAMINDVRSEWSGIILTYEKMAALASTAHALKYEDHVTPIKPEMFLNRRRQEDMSNDLWTIFNVIQENLINGGLTNMGMKRTVRTRGINNIYQNVSFNQGLWDAANKLALDK